MKYLILSACVIMFLSVSCSKEKQLVKFLEGTWETLPPTDSSSFYLQFTFEDCNNNSGCDGSYYIESPYDTVTISMTWELDDDVLTIGNASGHEMYRIIEWQDNFMQWYSFSFPEDTLDLMRIE